MTHSRQNNHNKNSNRHSTIGGNTGVGSSSGKGAQGAKNNNNQSSGSGGFAGSGDGGFGDIRGENDDDEDKPFRGHTVQVPSGGYRPAVHSVTANDDLEIEEDPVDNTGLTEDDNGEEEDEDDEEDVDVDEGPLEEDLNGHGDGNLDKDFGVNKPPFAPTTTDDEDLESQCMAFLYIFIIFEFLFETHLGICQLDSVDKRRRRRKANKGTNGASLDLMRRSRMTMVKCGRGGRHLSHYCRSGR